MDEGFKALFTIASPVVGLLGCHAYDREAFKVYGPRGRFLVGNVAE